MSYTYQRTIHFADTDAAGVVYFANYLSICHEAYEESLAAAGIEIKAFFSGHNVLVPVSKSTADYLRPLVSGDKVSVSVQPTVIDGNTYSVDYKVMRLGNGTQPDKLAAVIRTHHVCINAITRERMAFPAPLAKWLQAG